MSTHMKHIKTILSLVMFEDGHNYYLNQYMIDDIDTFKIQLDRALDYYSLPMSADDIIIYEEIKEEEQEIETEEESGSEDDIQELGYAL